MVFHFFEILVAVIFPLSEALLTIFKRAKKDRTRVQDEGSIGLLWAVILASIVLSVACRWVRVAQVTMPEPLRVALLLGLVLPGLALRWMSILTLGRYFTVDVAIHEDHQVIQSGPYRFVRHPSYTGVLMAFLGVGITTNNLLSLVVLVLPIGLAILHRIKVEERALRESLGEPYAAYCARTSRLIPGVY